MSFDYIIDTTTWKTNIIPIDNRSIFIFDRAKKSRRCEKALIKFSVYNRKKVTR